MAESPLLINLDRRGFIKKVAVVASSLIIPTYLLGLPTMALANNEPPESQNFETADISPTGHLDFWHQPRKLWLKRSGVSGDYFINYWSEGKVNTQDYIKACYLMMDTHVNQAVQMDIQLLNLMFAIQGWLGMNGIHLPIMINSGYRSKKTNNALEGAVKNSMHLYGKAADIRIPGIPIEYLGKLSSRFSAGGVGFYLRKGFVHIDTGRVRHWQG